MGGFRYNRSILPLFQFPQRIKNLGGVPLKFEIRGFFSDIHF